MSLQVVGIANLLMVFIFLVFWTSCFAVFYHLIRFGVGTLPKRLSALFLVGSVTLFCFAVVLYIKLDIASLLS